VEENLNYSDRFWTKWFKILGFPEEVPEECPSIMKSIYEVWTEKVPPDRIALVCGGYEMTAKEMINCSKRMIGAFKGLGLKKNDIVAMLMGNGIPLSLSMLAVQLAEMACQPISILQKTPEIERQLRESGTTTIICYESYLGLIESIKDKTQLKNIIVTSERDFTTVQEATVSDPPGAYQLRNLLAQAEPLDPSFTRDQEDVAVLIFTGGATGEPKGVQIPLRGFNYFEAIINTLFGPLQDVLVGHISMVVAQHIFHIGLATWLLGMRLGCTSYVVYDPRDTRSLYNYLTKPGVFFALYAPGQISRMIEMEDVDLTKIGHVISLSGMAALSPELGAKYGKKTGMSPVQAYGQTESTGLITLNLPGLLNSFGLGSILRKRNVQKIFVKTMPVLNPLAFKSLTLLVKAIGPDRLFGSTNHRILGFTRKQYKKKVTEEDMKEGIRSIGIPVWNTDVKIVDFEDKKTIVPVGEVGEICFKGPQRMKGYLQTEEGYTGPGYDEEGYVHTGDAGYMNEDGMLFITDRTKDMINVSGFKVYGTTVEDVVHQHPGVAMCAVIAVPDEKDPNNERVKLIVQLNREVEPSQKIEEEILKLCEDKLPPYAKPRCFEFMDEIPMLHTEKIDKKLLREREQKLGEEALRA